VYEQGGDAALADDKHTERAAASAAATNGEVEAALAQVTHPPGCMLLTTSSGCHKWIGEQLSASHARSSHSMTPIQ
jgi:hypothetical protein